MIKGTFFSAACLLVFSSETFAATKFSMDLSLEKLNYQKPAQGIGPAGSMVFKSASMVNDDLVININNVNNIFDSQIFVRPTFVGATTQFGNFGTNVKEDNLLNSIQRAELLNAKVLFDENQVNFSAKYLNFANTDTMAKLQNFRLYCQNGIAPSTEDQTPDAIKTCLNFLTLNGSFEPENAAADVEYEMRLGENLQDKLFVQSKIKSFDIRRDLISANILSLKSVSNDVYKIEATGINLDCAKDEDLETVDIDKIKKACTNRLNLGPLKASMLDSKEKTRFNLDLKSVIIKEKLLAAKINSAVITDPKTTTYVSNIAFSCKKELESDVFVLGDMLTDCFSYGRLTISEVRSDDKSNDDKDSSNKNIAISINNGVLVIKADVKFLGLKSYVAIYGKIAQNEARKQIIMTVTDTRLPLGINSVKLLMYFLKKNLVSKDISIKGNVITVSL
jgi:hypothetical protein